MKKSSIPNNEFSRASYAKGIEKGLIVGREQGRREAEALAWWLEGCLTCPTFEWSFDQEDAAWSTLNDYKRSIGHDEVTPHKRKEL